MTADPTDRPGDAPCCQCRVCPDCGSMTDTDPPEMTFPTLVATVGYVQATWSEASVAVNAAVADDWASAALLWTTAASAPARAAASTSP